MIEESEDEALTRARRVWSIGDYEPTGRQLEPAAEALVEALQVGPDDRVLDVGAGHGNCALASARRGAKVVATDFSPSMLRLGRARAAQERLTVEWREAEASALPFGTANFTVTTSSFGIIFAPNHTAAAAEAVRVTAPGGRVGLTAWVPDGISAKMLAAPRARLGAPPPAGPTMLDWGDDDYVRRRFEPFNATVTSTRRTLRFSYPSWAGWQTDIEAHGMMAVARETMTREDYQTLIGDVRGVIEEHAVGHGDEVAYDADYLEVVVTVA